MAEVASLLLPREQEPKGMIYPSHKTLQEGTDPEQEL